MAQRDGVYVALLRGVNVGGKNRLPMKDLSAMLARAGCGDVETYIQSGNAVFRASSSVAAGVCSTLAAAIRRRLHLEVPVVLRSETELAGAVAANPFLRRKGVDQDRLHLMFLADAPSPSAVASLDPRRSPGDELEVAGRDVYLHLPHGTARSKLTNDYFDARLGTVSTLRNWRTVQTLLQMAREKASSR